MNVKAGNSFRFNVLNLVKDESSYTHGMLPFVLSTKQKGQWKRGCYDVVYQRNQKKTQDRECAPDYEYDEDNVPCYVFEDEESKQLPLSTLSFSYTFEHDLDIVYFAHFEPFTYADMRAHLRLTLRLPLQAPEPEDPQQPPVPKKKEGLDFARIEKLCETVEGRLCPLLVISEGAANMELKELCQKKQTIVLTSRIHPGESNAQPMIQGVIEFLCSQQKEA